MGHGTASARRYVTRAYVTAPRRRLSTRTVLSEAVAAARAQIPGLYRGLTPPFFMAGMLNAVIFGTNGFMKRLVRSTSGTPDNVALSLPQVRRHHDLGRLQHTEWLDAMRCHRCCWRPR